MQLASDISLFGANNRDITGRGCKCLFPPARLTLSKATDCARPIPSLPFSYGLPPAWPASKGDPPTLAAGPEPSLGKTIRLPPAPFWALGPVLCRLTPTKGKKSLSQVVCNAEPGKEEDEERGGESKNMNFPPILKGWNIPASLSTKTTPANKARETHGLETTLHLPLPHSSPPYQPSSSGQRRKVPGTSKADVPLRALDGTNPGALCKGLDVSHQDLQL